MYAAYMDDEPVGLVTEQDAVSLIREVEGDQRLARHHGWRRDLMHDLVLRAGSGVCAC